MTVPVMQDGGDPMASDPPLFDDDLEGAWRTRFVMPEGRDADTLPEPPEGIELVEIPARKVAMRKAAVLSSWMTAVLRMRATKGPTVGAAGFEPATARL